MYDLENIGSKGGSPYFGSAVNFGLGLLGIGNSLSNQSQQQSNFDEQMRFAKYQYEDSKKYNSMKNQVARMRAAGINPALAIGSGQLGTAASSSSLPGAPNFDSLGVGEIGQSIASGYTADIQSRSVDADIALKDSQTKHQDIVNKTALAKELAQLEKTRSEIKKNNKDTAFVDNQIELLKKRLVVEDDMLQADLALKQNQAKNYQALAELNWSQQALTEYEATLRQNDLTTYEKRFAMSLAVNGSEIAQNTASAYLSRANAKTIDELRPEQKQQLAYQIVGQILENGVIGKQFEAFDVDKYFDRAGKVVDAAFTGILSAVGLKGLATGNVVKGAIGFTANNGKTSKFGSFLKKFFHSK